MAEQEVDYVAEATELGWMPKEKFRGKEDNWVDAETFVKRGEQMVPLLKAATRKLRDELRERDQRMVEMSDALRASQETIEGFKLYQEEEIKRRVERAKAELKKDLVKATQEGDVEAQVEIREAMDKLEKDGLPKPPEKKKDEPPPLSPMFISWAKDNPWMDVPQIGQVGDREKTAYAMAMGNYIQATTGLRDQAFLDKVKELVQDRFPDINPRRSAPEKVDGGRPTGSGSRSAKKGYADLPAEAKAICDRIADKVVGPNRAYKTVDEWRQKYASDVFSTE